ncbi:Lysophospholipase 1 [Pseudogymnoascus verrucosus]|uniref:Lysophospholipase n=1 Tax=Pseudogymnoascus verrucosus TaxID=342668 RepID=A0A1B8GS27_9PEZI|nr:Lysophospholipase 1 [Pseudogymnoascus verrucosus]OBT98654.1 Lysophospholipase 1 [Pseudogymnoascus verrucosus]
MKILSGIVSLATVAQLSYATAIVAPRDGAHLDYGAVALVAASELLNRGLPDSPTNGYAPGNVSCPATRPTIRNAASLSTNETEWLPVRRNNTIEPMKDLLSRANISGFDAAAYIEKFRDNATALPNIGIAISGGGYRALMYGAGFLAAADSRTVNATGKGGIGGLLQSATYLSGLSGGSWLVGSIYANNFSSVTTLRDGSPGSSVWQFGNSIFQGPKEDGISILNTAEYYKNIKGQVDSKKNAGYEVSITDYWGRALSYQLINATDGGPAYTFSSIALQDNFKNGETPFPVIVADGRAPGDIIVSLNTTVYEFNPFEMGSWDPTTFGFAPTRYLGSKFDGGVVPTSASCVRGFDNAGYVFGTSSTLFNQFILNINGSSSSLLTEALASVLKSIGQDNNDIAQYSPNPFFHYNPATNRDADVTELSLVDGGEDLQNIPLHPLIQPVRHLDVIFAVDASADTEFFWPNGTALVATYERSLNATMANGTSFPSIPDVNTFVNLGLNNRPTFFGCDPKNTTSLTPLVVYVPHAPYITHSNVSTFDPAYDDAQRNLIIQNGYDVATMGNGTVDAEWLTCLGCAVLSRSWDRTETAVPDACTNCFKRYCWDGSLNSTVPANYNPEFKVAGVVVEESGSGKVVPGEVVAVVVGVVVSGLMMF